MSNRRKRREARERNEPLNRLAEAVLSTWVLSLVAIILGAIWVPIKDKISIQWVVLAALVALTGFLSIFLKPERNARQRARTFCGLVILAGMLLGIGYLVSPDEASLDWYTKDENGQLELMNGKPLKVDNNQLGSDRLEIPIALAALNTGDRPLRDVKVEIRYPKDYTVIPQGKQRIDRQEGVLVYEHSLDELKVEGAAVFLEQTDKLVLWARVEIDDFIIFMPPHNTPIDGQVLVAVYDPKKDTPRTEKLPINSIKTERILLNVSLFSEGRKVVDRVMEVEIPVAFDGEMYMTESESQAASPEERGLAEYAIQAPVKTRMTGTVFDKKRPHQIDYRMGSRGTTRYQIIRVDGIPRRLIVDGNNDGLRDYELWTNIESDTRAFDTKFPYQKHAAFYPWSKYTVNGNLPPRRIK